MESWLAGAALVAAIATGALTYWLGYAPRRSAQRELAKTRSLKIELNGSDADECVWILPWEDDVVFMVELDVTLVNEGNLSVEDVTVELDVPSIIYVPELQRDPGGAAKLAGLQRETDPVDGTERTKLFFKVPAVHPNVSVHISDNIFLPTQSRVHSSVEATTKDGVPVRVGYDFVFGWAIRLSAHGRDVKAAKGHFEILSFSPHDKLLEPLADPAGAFARLVKILELEEKPKPVTAFVLAAEETGPAPKDIEEYLGVPSLKRVRLSQASRQSATHYGRAGYLPLKAEPASGESRALK